MRLRVATFNIKHGTRPGLRPWPWVTLPRLQAAVRSLDADVVGLQEVDRRLVRSWFVDQARYCAKAAGAPAYQFVRARWLLGGHYGNALVVRGELRGADLVRLPRPAGTEPRVALVAPAVVRETEVTLACTHLHNHEPTAAEQLLALLAVLATRRRPLVLMGDLNLPREQFVPVLEAAGFDPGPVALTTPWPEPARQIDVVAVAGGRVLSAEAPPEPTSDHRPVVADIELADA